MATEDETRAVIRLIEKGNIALKQLSEAMAIYPYAPLREKQDCFVSQKEHTVIIEKEGCTVTTI